MPFFDDVFTEIAVVLCVSATVGALFFCLRQPLISAFILVGILVGPVGFNLIHAYEQMALFAELGIGFLLFVVGLRLDPALIRAVSSVALVAGFGQIAASVVIGFTLALGLGMDALSALYVAAAVTFSSTIIIVKLLSDMHETGALHGRIALGVLVIQDIVVVLLMLILAASGRVGHDDFIREILLVLAKGSVFFVLLALFARYLLRPLLQLLSSSAELLVLFAIAWATGFASLGEILGFGKEVGALIAGVSIASTPYRVILAARLSSLRDFLLLFFFINLGAHVDISLSGAQIGTALVLSAFVLLGKPLIVTALVALMGYTRYTSSMAGLSLGQISEFSLILAALGVSLGHISEQTLGMITLVGLITIGFSTYMILHAHSLSHWLAPVLGILERNTHHPEQDLGEGLNMAHLQADVILFGLRSYGKNLAMELYQSGISILAVDFDPEVVSSWRGEGVSTLYGDIEDLEFFDALPFAATKWVVCTIKNRDLCLILLESLKHAGYSGRIALTANTQHDREILMHAGADLVFLPYQDAAKEAADLLTDSVGTG
jgi:Kef-type K+ transport system membrane component KefB